MIADPCMTESKYFRLVTIMMLYLAQGIPIGLLEFAIPAWMASNGATGAEIGYMIGLAGLPWALKFINGALIDRYAYLPMGRRRAWLIGAQLIMVGVLLTAAFIGPGPRDYVLLGTIAFAVYTAVVFQDVAADALAVDISHGSERGITGGLMSGGQALGIGMSSAIAGTIIYFFGISVAYAICALSMAVVCAYLVWVRERTGERRLPWSKGSAHPASLAQKPSDWIGLLKSAFKGLFRKYSLIWLFPLFFRGMAYGFMTVAIPLVAANYAGWNEAQLGSMNGTANLIAALITITIGGYLTAKIGSKPFQIITFLIFAALIIAFIMLEPSWGNMAMMTTIVIGWTVAYSLTGAPLSAINMTFCEPRTGATQFAIYMAVLNQGIVFAGFSFAFFEGYGGVPAVFAFLATCLILAAIIVAFIKLPEESEEAPVQSGSTQPI